MPLLLLRYADTPRRHVFHIIALILMLRLPTPPLRYFRHFDARYMFFSAMLLFLLRRHAAADMPRQHTPLLCHYYAPWRCC